MQFIDVNKMSCIGSGAERQIDDIMLTRLQKDDMSIIRLV